jgi:hypothetical protein
MRNSLVLILPPLVIALPRWSWDTLPTYFHCSNLSGPFSDDAITAIGRNSFAVFEKMTGMFSPPENKILSECARVKAVSPTTDCYMYTESDWARTWFTLGWEFDAHPEWELHLDAKPGSP